MKCRICGYELDGSTVFCPMCGSKIEARDIEAMNDRGKPEEFSWNTYDFPKPRQMQDIRMEWNGSMKDDASEGFVQTEMPPQPEYQTAQPDPAPFRQPEPAMDSWRMPEQKTPDETPLWATQALWEAKHLPQEIQNASDSEPLPHVSQSKSPDQFRTFYSKNDEFQKLLEQEYERAKALRGEDDTLRSVGKSTYTPQSSVRAVDAESFDEMLNAGTTSVDELSDNTITINIDRVHKGLDELFSFGEFGALENLENMEKTRVAEPVSADRGADGAFASSFDASTARFSLDEAQTGAVPIAERAAKAEYEPADAADALEELLSELKSSDDSFDAAKVRNTIETRIREIREREAQNKRFEMSRARQAYFDALDAVSTKAAVPEMKPEQPAPADPAPIKEAPAAEVPAAEEKPAAPAPVTAAVSAPEKTEASQPAAAVETEAPKPAADFRKVSLTDLSATMESERATLSELKGVSYGRGAKNPGKPATTATGSIIDYNDLLSEVMKPEPDEPKKERSHWFGKLIIAIIVIVVVFEAVVMGLKYFIPDHDVTKVLTLTQEMLTDIFNEAWKTVSEFFTGLVAKFIK